MQLWLCCTLLNNIDKQVTRRSITLLTPPVDDPFQCRFLYKTIMVIIYKRGQHKCHLECITHVTIYQVTPTFLGANEDTHLINIYICHSIDVRRRRKTFCYRSGWMNIHSINRTLLPPRQNRTLGAFIRDDGSRILFA